MPLAEHDHITVTVQGDRDWVSIHVPLAEHDEQAGEQAGAPEVSIHVPLAEHD